MTRAPSLRRSTRAHAGDLHLVSAARFRAALDAHGLTIGHLLVLTASRGVSAFTPVNALANGEDAFVQAPLLAVLAELLRCSIDDLAPNRVPSPDAAARLAANARRHRGAA